MHCAASATQHRYFHLLLLIIATLRVVAQGIEQFFELFGIDFFALGRRVRCGRAWRLPVLLVDRRAETRVGWDERRGLRMAFVKEGTRLARLVFCFQILHLLFDHHFRGKLSELRVQVAPVQISQGARPRLRLHHSVLRLPGAFSFLHVAGFLQRVVDALLQQGIALACDEQIDSRVYFGDFAF